MRTWRTVSRRSVVGSVIAVAVTGSAMLIAAVWHQRRPVRNRKPAAVLRVGVAQAPSTNPISGLRQLGQILAVESLMRPDENGRMQPQLAETWTPEGNGRRLVIKLRRGVKFHDGSPLDPITVAAILPDAMGSFMGSLFREVDYVKPAGTDRVEVAFRKPSPFLAEALEAQVRKQGRTLIGTGPFVLVPESTSEILANDQYYLGPPEVEAVRVQSYPSVRSAWAEMLREHLDMLYDVGSEAVDSMQNSSTTSLFTYTRHYQHIIALNTKTPALRSPEVRRALNMAINRGALVRSALSTYGIESAGPLWPQHWAIGPELRRFGFEPERVAETLSGRAGGWRLRFTCLVSPDSLDERIALEVKRQLAVVGIDMNVEQQTRDEIVRRAQQSEYEAALGEAIGGPSLFRSYMAWHSHGPLNWGHFGNRSIDEAFDRFLHVSSNDQYRAAVAELQASFISDPPAIFLAWSVRARAVTKRFAVPTPEAGRDVLSTLRLWKPIDDRRASRN